MLLETALAAASSSRVYVLIVKITIDLFFDLLKLLNSADILIYFIEQRAGFFLGPQIFLLVWAIFEAELPIEHG